MKFLFVLLFVVFEVAFCADIETEDEVLVLKKDNFDEAIEKNKYILVEFYAPWCGHCKALAPEYAKAAKQLKEASSEIRLAKVDATVEKDLAKKYNVEGFPTLFFFKSGTKKDYKGGRTAEKIIEWLNKQTGAPAVSIDSISVCEKFVDFTDVAVVGFFSDVKSKDAIAFLEVAADAVKHPFAITSNFDVFDKYDVIDNTVVVFKKFEEKRNDLKTELTVKNIERFVDINSVPSAVEANGQTLGEFIQVIREHVWLLIGKSHKNYESIVKSFKEVAKDFKGMTLFVILDSDDAINANLFEFLGITDKKSPQLRYIRIGESNIGKFVPTTEEVNKENIKKFVKGVIRGQIKRFLKAEKLPEDWDKKPVKVLVASNFKEIALDKSKDVLVEFYAPWCGHCKKLAPIYDELGEKFKDNANVVIAKVNAVENEFEDIDIEGFPTIKLWKKGSNEVVDFNGNNTLEDLIKFVESGGESGKESKAEATHQEL